VFGRFLIDITADNIVDSPEQMNDCMAAKMMLKKDLNFTSLNGIAKDIGGQLNFTSNEGMENDLSLRL
jgi:hypothetical protein